jgi:hypothetical protein
MVDDDRSGTVTASVTDVPGWASLLQVGRLDPETIIFTTTAPKP